MIDKGSSVGHLDKALAAALKQGWQLADMRKDWNVVYPFELEKVAGLKMFFNGLLLVLNLAFYNGQSTSQFYRL